jgi:zinc and cadmium transporter
VKGAFVLSLLLLKQDNAVRIVTFRVPFLIWQNEVMKLLLIILFSFFASVGAIILASLTLLPKKEKLAVFIYNAISFATGTLLSAAFTGLIPHAAHNISLSQTMGTVLASILFFFILEKFMIMRHCHTEHCDIHSSAGNLILIGDAFHNFVDGVAIATAVTESFELGITATLAIIAHEIPQEIGDFAILIHSGYSKSKAIAYNILSSLSTFLGAFVVYFATQMAQGISPYLMAISAGSFIYIALADLVPTRRRPADFKSVVSEIIFILLGIAIILMFHHNCGETHLH